jgi:hypothetical protein
VIARILRSKVERCLDRGWPGYLALAIPSDAFDQINLSPRSRLTSLSLGYRRSCPHLVTHYTSPVSKTDCRGPTSNSEWAGQVVEAFVGLLRSRLQGNVAQWVQTLSVRLVIG